MDIKLKNIKKRNNQDNVSDEVNKEKVKEKKSKLKLVKYKNNIIYLLITVLLTSVILLGLEVKQNFKFIIPSRAYTSTEIAAQIQTYTYLVERYSLYYKEKDYLNNKENITDDDIKVCKQELMKKIDDEFIEFENLKNNEYNFNKLDYEERQKILDEEKTKIIEKYTLNDKEMENYILERKNNSANELNNKINSYVNLKYVAYDKVNDIWIGGEERDIKNERFNSRYFKEINIDYNGNTIKKEYINGKEYVNSKEYIKSEELSHHYNQDLNKNNIDLYVWIPKGISSGDIIYEQIINMNKSISKFFMALIIFIVLLAALILSSLYIKKHNIRSEEVEKIINKFKNYPIEYKLGVGILACILWSWNVYGYYNQVGYANRFNIHSIITGSLVIAIDYLIIRVLIVNYKEGTLLENNITVKVYKELSRISSRGSIIRSILISLSVYVALGLVLLFMALIASEWFLLFFTCGIIMTIILLIIGIRKIIYLDKIMEGVKDVAEGKLNAPIKEKGNGQLAELAHNINNIKEGLRKSLENEMKSESMKTELITNVSHDLKTPLTSIINYIELLKREDIKPETAKDYVSVLDKKSQRLKVLIEDLFEASKAASGAMELNITKLDIGELLRQAVGENNERFEDKNLEVKLNIPQEKIFVNGDGKRLYRVFENLISNSVNYSLSNTRVYIDMKREEDGEVNITVKNISAYELNFDTNEITSRFKRGDASRTTEGSGLGLAIAKSIIELHGGEFNIAIDGDLFKAIIVLKQ